MDGFGTDEAVIILAATNLADSLDPAIKRPGRFDRTIEITLPTIDERREIYNVHLKKIKVNKERTRDEYATKMSALTPGFSGADIANICNEGAIIAARQDFPSVSLKEFEQATERVLAGIEKKSIMTPAERKTVAYHEAGHAVAGWFLEHANPLLKITIIPRSKGSLGFAQYLPEEISLYTKEAIIDQIKVALGGRVSEQLTFNKITTGASDDIKKITQMAQGLIQVYGMSAEFGLRSYQSQEGLRAYSEHTAEKIDLEVKNVVDQCYREVEQLLTEKKELIEK
jgi:AFG3 family protein